MRRAPLTLAVICGLLLTGSCGPSGKTPTSSNPPSFKTDARGKLTDVAGADGLSAHFAYDDQERLAEIIDPAGRSMRFKYGADDQPTEIAGPGASGPVRRFEYDSAGRPTRITIDGETLASFVYDAQGRPVERHVRGHLVRFAYDAAGRVGSETDELGRVWTYGYDEQGRLAEITNPDGGIERAARGDDGRVIGFDDATGVRQLISARPSTGRPGITPRSDVHYTIDVLGRVLAQTDAAGARTLWDYDEQSRLIGMTLPNGQKLQFEYDALGRPAKTSVAYGQSVSYTYDTADHLVGVESAAHERASYARDVAGRLMEITRPNGSKTRLAYDTGDRLTELHLPGGGVRKTSYDLAGRLTGIEDAGGHSVVFAHDRNGREAARIEGTRSSLFIYDNDRLAAVDDRVWPVRYAYDGAGRVAQTSFPAATNASLTFKARTNGQRSALDTPAGHVGYEYNDVGQLTALATPAGSIAFAYDQAGRIATMRLPNGLSGAWKFAADGKLSSLQWSDARGTTLAQWSVSYDRLGLSAQIAAKGFPARQFTYDTEGRLTQERRGTDATSYEYGAGGDRTRIESASAALDYHYDTSGRLADAGGPVVHDADDRVISQSRGGAVWGYAYDAENRLVGAVGPTPVTFAYDAFGNPVHRESTLGVRSYLFDEGRPIVALDREGRAVALNIFAPGCMAPILTIENGQAYFLPCDAFGATALVTDGTGATVGTAEIDAFGKPIVLPDRPFDLFLLHGMPYDRELGLYRAGVRQYDPALGRFLTPDPLISRLTDLEALNSYAFARNAPTAFADPTGAAPVDWRVDMAQHARDLGITEAEFADMMNDIEAKMGPLNAPNASTPSGADPMDAVLDAVQDAISDGEHGPDAVASINARLAGSGSFPSATATPSQNVSVAGPNDGGADITLGRVPSALPVPSNGASGGGGASDPSITFLETPPEAPSVSLPGVVTPPPNAPSSPSGGPISIAGLFDSMDHPFGGNSGSQPLIPSGAPAAPQPPLSPVGSSQGPDISLSDILGKLKQPSNPVNPAGTPSLGGSNPGVASSSAPMPDIPLPANGAGGMAPAPVPGANGPSGYTTTVSAPASALPAPHTFGPWTVKMPSLADGAKAAGALAVVNGISDALNCAAKEKSTNADCLAALGSGTGKGLVGGVLGSIAVGLAAKTTEIVVGTSVRLLTGAAATAAGATAGTAVAVVATVAGGTAVGLKAGKAIFNYGSAKLWGTTEKRAASLVNLSELDQGIYELYQIAKSASEAIEEPLTAAKGLRAEFGLGALKDKPVDATPSDAAQMLGTNCSVAKKALADLASQAKQADQAARDAIKALKANAKLDLETRPTLDATSKADRALLKFAAAIEAAKGAGTALGAVALAMPQLGDEEGSKTAAGAEKNWKKKLTEYSGLIGELEKAVESVDSHKERFDALHDRLLAAAEGMRATVVRTDQAALESRINSINAAPFAASALAEQAGEIIKKGRGDIAAITEGIKGNTEVDKYNEEARAKICGDLIAAPGAPQQAAGRALSGPVKTLQATLTNLSEALRQRGERLRTLESKSASNIAVAQQKLKDAAEANNPENDATVATLERVVSEEKDRQQKILMPQRSALDAMNSNSSQANTNLAQAVTALSFN